MNKKQEFIDYKKIDGEIWKPIKLCGSYEVSNFGRIKIGSYIVVPSDRYGYQVVRLHKTGEKRCTNFLVHRLVAETFIPNPNSKPEVDHIDTNKSNNRADNLRWCWHLENMMDNSTTFSKLNAGFRKKIIYESIRQDLYYQEKSKALINYSDSSKEKVKEITGKDVSELLLILQPSNFGKKTVNNLHFSESEETKKINVTICLTIDDIHPGMLISVGKIDGKIISVNSLTHKIAYKLKNGIYGCGSLKDFNFSS